MSAIEKLCCKHYTDYMDFVNWCADHNPYLFMNFRHNFIYASDWDRLKRHYSTNTECGVNAYVTIANFSSKQDKYLYWHCPFDFVREYLEKQCGYKKANWFVKLFWKY